MKGEKRNVKMGRSIVDLAIFTPSPHCTPVVQRHTHTFGFAAGKKQLSHCNISVISYQCLP